MAFLTNKTRVWDRATPNDGFLLEDEYNRLYDNFREFLVNGNMIVNNDTASPSLIQLTNLTTGTETTKGLKIGIESTGEAVINQQENQNLVIKTNNSTRLTIDNNGIATFNSIPSLPATNPVSDNQVTRKAYVDQQIARNAALVGSIVAWLPGYFSGAGNAGFTSVAQTLPAWWKECNGTAPNDPESPIFNASNRFLPDLRDDRFLMGTSTTLGVAGGSNSMAHTHTFTQPGNHANHVFTPPADHTGTYPNHSHNFQQPSAHTGTYPNHSHSFNQPSAHTGTYPDHSHIFQQPFAHTITIPNHKHKFAEVNGTPAGTMMTSYRSNGSTGTILGDSWYLGQLASGSNYNRLTMDTTADSWYTLTDGGGGSCSVSNNHSGGAVQISGGGNISISEHSGGAVLSSGGGSISISEHSGGAVLSSGGGSISISSHTGGGVDAHSSHTGGSVNAASTEENRPKYLSVKYVMKIK